MKNPKIEIPLSTLWNWLELSFKKCVRLLFDPIGFRIHPEDMKKLQIQRFTYPHPLVRRLLHALFFLGLRVSMRRACKYAGISPQAIRLVKKIYLQGGVEEIKRMGSKIPIRAVE